MNKTIVGAVVVVILAVGAYFAFMNKPEQDGARQENSQTQQSNNEQQQTTESDSQTRTSTLKDIVAQGSKKCTYTFQGDASKSEPSGSGIIYTANGNAGMDISAVVNGVSMVSKVVIKDNIYYGWVDGQPTGLKMTFNDADAYNTSVRQGVDINQEYNYTCENWNPDSAKFNVPANVQFTDLASLNTMGGN
jgi:uncharacterized protein YxeA